MVPSHVLDLTRHALAQEFGTNVSPPSAGGLFGDLLGTIAAQAEDPETEAATVVSKYRTFGYSAPNQAM